MDEAQVWLRAGSRAGSHAGGRVTIEEKCLKRLHSVKGRKATNLVHAKRRFDLVIRLIANECYEGTFYFLSFLPTVLRLPSSASHARLIY